jgi:hypothetical protein
MKDNKYFDYLILVLILLLGVSVLFVSVKTINSAKEGGYLRSSDYITASGEGEVFAKPDLALLSFSVSNEAKEANEALSKNTEKTNALIAFLKESGIEEKDIKTTTFSITPRYEYQSEERLGYYSEGKRVLVGYETQQTVEVKVREMEKIGEIVKGGVSAGANQIGSVSFTIENKEEIEKEAREMAIKNAKEKAKEMEKELGIKLGRLTSFSEYNDNGVYARTLGAGEMQKVMLDSVATPEIATGENRITSNVSLVYEIK